MDRITAIKESLAVFVCGVLSFFPVVGLLPAIYALANWYHVRLHCGDEWNPADYYLKWGALLALLNLILSLLLCAGAAIYIITRNT